MLTKEEFSRLSVGSKVKVTGSIWVKDGIYEVCDLEPYHRIGPDRLIVQVDCYGGGSGLWVESSTITIPNKIYLGGE